MEDANKNVIITEAAREKICKARAGEIKLPKIIGMAFGDGGTDSSGNIIPPADGQSGLTNELLRKEIDGYSFINKTACRYTCTLSENELANTYISELGLYDEDGDLVCIKTFMRKGKDDDLEMAFEIDDVF